jgi:hypothetical protein
LNLLIQLTVDALLIVSVWLLPTRRILAMQLLIAGQAILLVYLFDVGQHGFWPWNVGMIIVAARNWRAWSHVDHAV